MALDFAPLEQLAGSAIRARFRNASLVNSRGGGEIEGHYTASPADVGVGPVGMTGRDVSFLCSAADCDAQGVDTGSEVQITRSGVVERWQVAERLNDLHMGDATLILKRAR